MSTARATELVRLLITKYTFAPERLSAAGYAEYHPVADNDSEESRAQNRRVDIVILSRALAGKSSPRNAPAANEAQPATTPSKGPVSDTIPAQAKPSAAVPVPVSTPAR